MQWQQQERWSMQPHQQKAAADINEECLRGLSAPAGSVTSEGGASVSMGDVLIQWCNEVLCVD